MADINNDKEDKDKDKETGVSMVEVLEEEEKLEQDASAVLGASDHSNCTYILGYVPRQAIYACATCTHHDKDTGGICLACSLECHDGHELIELYTKRNFKCDCGNSRLPDVKCKFIQDKDKSNTDNKYNHNFRGTYCICARPYPDPDDDIEDEMIQCIICEDWYHGRHLGSKVPDNDNYDEMICDGCMQQNDFLWKYTLQSEENLMLSKEEMPKGNNVDIMTNADKTHNQSPNKKNINGSVQGSPSTSSQKQSSDTKDEADGCTLADLQKRIISKSSGATFWQAGWRSKLCTCDNCKDMYRKNNLEFLLDEDDPVQVYEAKGKAQHRGSQYDQGMQALSSMGRLQQVEVLHEYNDLKTELKDYLKRFADNKKMVREEDIKEFFTQMSARKRRKTSDGMQYFCK